MTHQNLIYEALLKHLPIMITSDSKIPKLYGLPYKLFKCYIYPNLKLYSGNCNSFILNSLHFQLRYSIFFRQSDNLTYLHHGICQLVKDRDLSGQLTNWFYFYQGVSYSYACSLDILTLNLTWFYILLSAARSSSRNYTDII